MHALLVGATGATGKDLLEKLLNDPYFEKVDIFVRREVDLKHEKLTVNVVEFARRDEWEHLVKGDVLFSCLGTTLKAAGSKSEQWRVDYEYQYEFALAAKKNNVTGYVLVSAGYASPRALLFYPRMKGRLEYAVKLLNFNNTAIFKPPLLIRKGTDRKGELSGQKLITWLNKIGLFHSQKPLPTSVLAQAMVNAARTENNGFVIFKDKEIWERAHS